MHPGIGGGGGDLPWSPWGYPSPVPSPAENLREQPAHPAGPRSGEGEHPCVEVSPREASYLRALLELGRAPGQPTQAALARAAGVSAPTTLQMVRRLRELGLVEPDAMRLTVEGTSAARVLASRHHAAALLTRDVLGLSDGAEIEAARLAPSMSRQLTRHLIRQAAQPHPAATEQ